jgi:serine/threonine protein kinase
MKQKKLKCTDEFLDLLVGMLQPDPTKRITLEDIKAHPWLNDQAASQSEINDHYQSLKT